MAPKFNAKNLQYSSTLPPFLARLRGEASSSLGEGPDPILAAQKRPSKKRSDSAEREDAPTVVDTEGNILGDIKIVDGIVHTTTKEETETDTNKRGGTIGDGDGDGGTENDKDKDKKNGEGSVGIGAGNLKKRKVGRVIGAEEPEEQEAKGKEKVKSVEDIPSSKKKGDKKKAKKIKLSFGDDEG